MMLALGAGGWAAGLFHPHSHDAADFVDSALESSDRGIRALKVSLVALLVTAVLQGAVVAFSGSVALLADTVHNVADAGTAIPLNRFEEGRWYSEGQAGLIMQKDKGGEPRELHGATDSTQALVKTLNEFQPDLFLTSGHATERDWQIGYSYRNGYGYILNGTTPLIFYHAGSIGGAKIDIENPPLGGPARSLLDIYDVRYKFWSAWEGGVRINIRGVINVYSSYEHSIVYRDFRFTDWFGSSLTEFIPQRIIDIFAGELLRQNPDTYPLINFLAKNAISAFIYEMKRRNSYFPFKSQPSINYDTYRIGLSLVF
jgi:hypothetical protein